MLIERIFGGSARFRSNFVKIASASLIAQLIGLISLPFLTRIFSSSEFGVLTTYTMIQGIGLGFITGRLDWIIPNAKTKRQAIKLIGVGVLFVVFFMLVCALIVMAFKEPIALWFKLPTNHIVLELLPIGLLAGGFQLLFQAWFIFKGDLGAVGWSKLAQSIITLTVSLGAGLLTFTTNGLVLGYVAGLLAAASVLLWKSEGAFPRFTKVDLKHYYRRAQVYGTQILSSVGLSLVNVCLTMSLIMLILTFYGNTILGWYGLVFRIATAPIGLITTALAQSFWTDAAILVKKDPEQLWAFYKNSILRLIVLALPMCLVFLCGPFYIPLLFGAEEWSGAGVILMAVTPYLFGMIVFSPTTHLIVYGKAHWQLMCDVSTLGLSVIVFSTLAKTGFDAHIAIFGSSLVMLFGYLARFVIHKKANTQATLKMKSS